MRRYKKKHPEEFEEHKKDVLQKTLDGVDFYTAFDKVEFKHGSQYKYLKKITGKLADHL